MNKTYKTLDGAYARADKLGAKNFCADYYGYEKRLCEALDKTFTTLTARRLAKHNLVKLDKTLYALTLADGAYKWTAVGTFDHEGIFYPTSADTQKTHTRKSGTWADGTPIVTNVRGGKGNSIPNALKKDLDKLAGTGDNSKAHKVMCKHGLKMIKSPEYEAVWKGYWWTIR